jgi:1,4-alpha-glucan branching enzyme
MMLIVCWHSTGSCGEDRRDGCVKSVNFNRYGYRIGFPTGGNWREVFNSDVYDNWVNPQVVGNAGAVSADEMPMHGFSYSAALTLPANSLLIFNHA